MLGSFFAQAEPMTLVQALLAAMVFLVSILAGAWKIIHGYQSEVKRRSDKMETKLEENYSETSSLRAEVSGLQGRIGISEELAPTLSRIDRNVGKVLETLNGKVIFRPGDGGE